MRQTCVNLYVLTRAISSQQLYCESMTSGKYKKFREYEYLMLRTLVDSLDKCGIEMSKWEGFVYSFSIPYISCEFDLLKIDKNRKAINIELKSEPVPEEEIAKQLRRLRSYLQVVADEIYSFAVVNNFGCHWVYCLEGEELVHRSFGGIAFVLRQLDSPVCESYADLFKPSDYLVSPINSPEKFLAHKYFLTQQQEDIKTEVIKSLRSNPSGILAIKGSAGTGKTLLLYDIAYEISKKSKVCIIHCGKNSDGHGYLHEHWKNAMFPYIARLHMYLELDEAEYFFVDEAHRLTPETFDYIQKRINHPHGVVFSYDSYQILSKSEETFNAAEKIENELSQHTYRLTGRIRTNPEIISFINSVFKIHPDNQRHDFSNISVISVNGLSEAKKIIEYYTTEKGYTFINYTPSVHCKSIWNEFSKYPCTHEVIGQEFDNVLVVMDDNFQFTDGKIVCREHPNPNYLYGKMLYQAMSRTRIRLCIVVLNNNILLEQLLRIKNNNFEKIMEVKE